MRYRFPRFNQLKLAIKNLLVEIFDTPFGRPARKVLITICGIVVILSGIALIVLPGPAIILIPLGLAILAIEYPGARKWLRKFQHWITLGAKKADDFFDRRKAKL